MRRCVLAIACLCICMKAAHGQVFQESFDSIQLGVVGPCSQDTCSAMFEAQGWQITGDFSALLQPNDYFRVESGRLVARDVGKALCVSTPAIQLAEQKVNVWIDVGETGDLEQTTDFVDVFLLLDADTFMIPNWNGLGNSAHTLIGDRPDDEDWGIATVFAKNVGADSMRVMACVRNNSDSEQIWLDNLLVASCDTCCGVFGWEVDGLWCNSDNASYNAQITYRGSHYGVDLLLRYDGQKVSEMLGADLDGTVIRLDSIPAHTDWTLEVSSSRCADTIEGIAPFCEDVPAIYISEIDSDQSGSVDSMEFVELGGVPFTSLEGIVTVLYNGSNSGVYGVIDLTGAHLDANGMYVICFGNNSAPYCDTTVSRILQNGPDGIALYYGRQAAKFVFGKELSLGGLIDGLRYDTDDDLVPGLAGLDIGCANTPCQMNEHMFGAKDDHSIQRGSWYVAPPTPGQPNVPLPIGLLDFRVAPKNGVANLHWQTISEHGSDYFEVQHRVLRSEFLPVGRVNAATESSQLRQYNFRHHIAGDGIHYYRLKMVDLDGAYQYSPIEAVRLGSDQNNPVQPFFVGDALLVPDVQNEPVHLLLFDTAGQLVLHRANIPEATYVGHLANGVYLAMVQRATVTRVQKVLKS